MPSVVTGKHTAMFLFCLQSWLVLSSSAMPVPAIDEMKVPVESQLDISGKQHEKGLSPSVTAGGNLNSNAGNLMMRNDEVEDDSNDANILRHMADTRTIQEKKRRLRLVTGRKSGADNSIVEQEPHQHSLHKRETERDRRTWSISNALSVLTDMVVEHEQRRLAEQREALKRRLLELGKRSHDNAVVKADISNGRDQDFVSLLQAALSSSESF